MSDYETKIETRGGQVSVAFVVDEDGFPAVRITGKTGTHQVAIPPAFGGVERARAHIEGFVSDDAYGMTREEAMDIGRMVVHHAFTESTACAAVALVAGAQPAAVAVAPTPPAKLPREVAALGAHVLAGKVTSGHGVAATDVALLACDDKRALWAVGTITTGRIRLVVTARDPRTGGQRVVGAAYSYREGGAAAAFLKSAPFYVAVMHDVDAGRRLAGFGRRLEASRLAEQRSRVRGPRRTRKGW